MGYLRNQELGFFHDKAITEKSSIPANYDVSKLGDSLNWASAYASAVPVNVILDTIKQFGVTNQKSWNPYRDNVPHACHNFWNKYIAISPQLRAEMRTDALCYTEFYQNDEIRDKIIKEYYQYENQKHLDNFGTPFSAKSCQRLGIAGTKYAPVGACGNVQAPIIDTQKIPVQKWNDAEIAQSAGISLIQYQQLDTKQKQDLIKYIQSAQSQSGGFRLPKLPIPIPAFLALVAGGIGLAWLTSRKK